MKQIGIFALVVVMFAIGVVSINAQRGRDAEPLRPVVRSAVKFDVSPPLRSITPLEDNKATKGEDDRTLGNPIDQKHTPDGALQNWMGQGIFNSGNDVPDPIANFRGIFQASGPSPPDTVGDVGPNHYVQMVNSRFQIFTKAGVSVFGPAAINTLFAGFGGACQNENAGDPIVLYDQFADRWLLTQFTAAGPVYFNCVALSTSGDPTGTYYRWAFSNGSLFPDYPKYGVWRDGYYLSTRDFAGGSSYTSVSAFALNRDQMLLGNPNPQVVSFIVPRSAGNALVGDGILPADIDGNLLPPVGSPAYFVTTQDNGGPYAAASDAMHLYKFAVNWADPGSSTFSLTNTLPMAAFDTIFPCVSGRNCIPQPGTAQGIDILSYRQRPLHRLAYRNFLTHESLVTSQSVEAQTGIAGMRWWEVRSPNSSPVIYQEGTYSPDTTHRWMGSIAMDRSGNMLLGYSASSSTVFPSLRYTGRLANDPLGTMPQGEATLFAGTGSQTSTGARWGDYSSMNVDPVDDCTFWYTNQYYATTSATGWSTRVGSVKFPQCQAFTAAGVDVSGRVLTANGLGIRNAVVKIRSLSSQFERTLRTSALGYYSFESIPVGDTYVVSVSSLRHGFPEPTRILNLSDPVSDFNFVAFPQ